MIFKENWYYAQKLVNFGPQILNQVCVLAFSEIVPETDIKKWAKVTVVNIEGKFVLCSIFVGKFFKI